MRDIMNKYSEFSHSDGALLKEISQTQCDQTRLMLSLLNFCFLFPSLKGR